jgi:hypothetical protein
MLATCEDWLLLVIAYGFVAVHSRGMAGEILVPCILWEQRLQCQVIGWSHMPAILWLSHSWPVLLLPCTILVHLHSRL